MSDRAGSYKADFQVFPGTAGKLTVEIDFEHGHVHVTMPHTFGAGVSLSSSGRKGHEYPLSVLVRSETGYGLAATMTRSDGGPWFGLVCQPRIQALVLPHDNLIQVFAMTGDDLKGEKEITIGMKPIRESVPASA